MNLLSYRLIRAANACLSLILVLTLTGCMWIADKGRIKVAEIDGKGITRDDLDQVIRDKETDEKPIIESRGDLLRVLEEHIDYTLKQNLAKEFADEGKLNLPREMAARQLDMEKPDFVRSIQNAQEIGLSPGDITYLEQEREIQIDKVHERLMGEAALGLWAQEALADGILAITDDDYAKEFEWSKNELRKAEQTRFEGIFFPIAGTVEGAQQALSKAQEVIGRLKQGENFDDVAAEKAASNEGFVFRTELPNNPSQFKFRSFWEQAEGQGAGSIVGPVPISGWEQTRQDPGGNVVSQPIPDSYLVAHVLENTPQRPLTLEEAKEPMSGPIIYAKSIAKLREIHKVQIYEDKLKDPSIYQRDRGGMMRN